MKMECANPVEARRRREENITPDLLYLVAKFLDSTDCKRAAKVLFEEIRQLKLVPDRFDWLGNKHERTLEEWDRLHPHIGGQTLLRMCGNLLPLLDRLAPSGVAGVQSLLGAGSSSALRTEPGCDLHHFTVDRVTARIGGRPLLDPVGLRHLPALAVSTFGRELQGSCARRHLSTERLFCRMQLLKRTLGHLSAVYCCLFDRTGFNIITGADDRLVKVWSALDGRLLATLRGAAAEISDLAISPDNALLAAGSCDKVIRVWDLLSTAPVAVLSGHGGMITALEFCPGPLSQQRFLVSTSNDGCVAFWSYRGRADGGGGGVQFAARPIKINERVRPGQAQLICAAFSTGGTFLAIGGADHHVRVYRTTGADGPERILELEAHSDRVDSIQWCHSGCRFVSGSKDGTAIVWSFQCQEWSQRKLTMDRLPEFREPHDDGRQRPLRVTMVRWTTDDARVITTVSDTSFRVWDADTGRLEHVLAGHTDEVYVVESHPTDPRLVLSAGHDGKLVIWDVRTGIMLASFFNAIEGEGHGGLFDARWSPCGLFIAATDSHGHLSHFGVSGNDKFRKVPYEQFFHTDYRPLMRDARHQVLDEQTQMAPHLLPPPLLVDRDGNPQPARCQRLVPGREHQTDEQLVPVLQPVSVEEEDEVDVELLGPDAPRRRPTIDDMVEQLAVEQVMRETAAEAAAGEAGAAAAAAAGGAGDQAPGRAPPRPQHQSPARPGHNWLRRRFVPRLTAQLEQQLLEHRTLQAELEVQHYEAELSKPRRPASPAAGQRLTTRERRRQRQLRRRRQPEPAPPPAADVQEQRVTRAARSARAPFSEDFENPDNLSLGEETAGSSSGSSGSESEPARRSDGSESSEYSDWVAESGVALNPPQRQPKRLTARQRALRRRMRSGASEPEPSAADPRPGPSGTQSRPARRPSPQPPASPPAADRQRPAARPTRKRGGAGAGAGESSAGPAASAAEEVAEPFLPSAWLSEVLPRKTPYFPQMGDELIYFRQGHQLYVEAVRRRKIYEISPKSLPWAKQPLRDRELVKIIGVKYELRPPCLCCLKLGKLDAETGAVTGSSFTIKYHDMPDVVDFLVLRPAYEAAVSRSWKAGDRFRSTIDDAWWTGRVLERRPLDPDAPESPFLCYRVAWDTGESEPLSPWDMEPPDPSQPSDDESSQSSVPLTDAELRGAGPGWRQRPEDWLDDDPQAQMDRIRHCLENVMQLAIAEPFLAPVDLNLYPTYALTVEYPIDLSTIKARLENGFYRRITAVQFDVRYLATNTEKFNQPHSTIVRSARIITDVCLEMIGDRSCFDPGPLYRRHSQAYSGAGGGSGGRQRSSRAPPPPAAAAAAAGPAGGRPRGSQRSPRVTRQIARRRFTDKSWEELCMELLENLFRHEDSVHFREPVNLDEYPDYLQTVESPMDLSTIREELEACSYVSPQEFSDDVRLIFHNSKTYNTNKRSTIFAMTLRLSCYFEEQMKPILTYFVSGQRSTRSRRRHASDSDPQPSSSRPVSLRQRPQEDSGRRLNGFHRDSEDSGDERAPARPGRQARGRLFQPPAPPPPPASGRLRGRAPVSYAEDSDSSATPLLGRRAWPGAPATGRSRAPPPPPPRPPLPPPSRPHGGRHGLQQQRRGAVQPEAEVEEGQEEEEEEDGSSSSSSSSSSSGSGEEEEEDGEELAEEEEEGDEESDAGEAAPAVQSAPRLRTRAARSNYAVDDEEEEEVAAPRGRRAVRAPSRYGHDSDWDAEAETAQEPRRTGRVRQASVRSWRTVLDEDDEVEDDDDDDDDFKPSRKRSRPPKKKAKKRRRDADSEDSEEERSTPKKVRRRPPAADSGDDFGASRSTPKKSKRKRRAPNSEESEEAEPPSKSRSSRRLRADSEDSEEVGPPSRPRSSRRRRADSGDSEEEVEPPSKSRSSRRRPAPDGDLSDEQATAPSRPPRRAARRHTRVLASDDDDEDEVEAAAARPSRSRVSPVKAQTNGVGSRKSSRSAAARAHALLALSDEDDSDEGRRARLERRLAHADAGWDGPPPEPRRRAFVSRADDEDDDESPRISVSSRGRVRKLNPHAFTAD